MGICPQKLKRGLTANPCKSAMSGTQNAGKPSANRSGQNWGSRAKPLSVINKRASKEVSYESLHFL